MPDNDENGGTSCLEGRPENDLHKSGKNKYANVTEYKTYHTYNRYQRKTPRVDPPAGGSVPKTIYVNQAKTKNSNVTAYVHIITRKTVVVEPPAGDVPKKILHKSGKNQVCMQMCQRTNVPEKEQQTKRVAPLAGGNVPKTVYIDQGKIEYTKN